MTGKAFRCWKHSFHICIESTCTIKTSRQHQETNCYRIELWATHFVSSDTAFCWDYSSFPIINTMNSQVPMLPITGCNALIGYFPLIGIYVPISIVSPTYFELTTPLYSPHKHLHNDTTLIKFRGVNLILLIALPNQRTVLLTDPDNDNQDAVN
jgi:hypothetical protein